MGLLGRNNAWSVWASYLSAVIVGARWPYLTPPTFNAKDAAFSLIGWLLLMRYSLVSSPTILGSIGIGESVRNPLTMFDVPAMSTFSLSGIDVRLVPWYN